MVLCKCAMFYLFIYLLVEQNKQDSKIKMKKQVATCNNDQIE